VPLQQHLVDAKVLDCLSLPKRHCIGGALRFFSRCLIVNCVRPGRTLEPSSLLEHNVVAQQQDVAAQEVHQEEAGEDQPVQVEHLDLRHLKFRTSKKIIFEAKHANNRKYAEYAIYAVYAKYGNRCDMQNMSDMSMICRSDM
jgi:hypothetical protein